MRRIFNKNLQADPGTIAEHRLKKFAECLLVPTPKFFPKMQYFSSTFLGPTNFFHKNSNFFLNIWDPPIFFTKMQISSSIFWGPIHFCQNHNFTFFSLEAHFHPHPHHCQFLTFYLFQCSGSDGPPKSKYREICCYCPSYRGRNKLIKSICFLYLCSFGPAI